MSSRPMCFQEGGIARCARLGNMGTSLAAPLHRRKSVGTRGQRDPAFRSGLTGRGRENAWCVSTCRVVVAELERSRRSPNEAKIEFMSISVNRG